MSLTDVAFMRSIAHAKDHRGNPAVTILTPSDAPSAYAMTLEMAEWPSAVFLRTLRADVGLIYGEAEAFPFGKFKVLRKATGKGKKITIAAVGYLVHTILKALPQFEAAGLDVVLVDAYCLPFDTGELFKLAEGGPVLTVEDSYVGGVGSEVAEAAARQGGVRVDSLAVRNIPKSGRTPEDVLAYCHLSEADILAKAKEMTG
jgi:transketolase